MWQCYRWTHHIQTLSTKLLNVPIFGPNLFCLKQKKKGLACVFSKWRETLDSISLETRRDYTLVTCAVLHDCKQKTQNAPSSALSHPMSHYVSKLLPWNVLLNASSAVRCWKGQELVCLERELAHIHRKTFKYVSSGRFAVVGVLIG